MKLYYGVDPSMKREALISNKKIRPFIDDILDSAEKAIKEDSYAFRITEYNIYFKTGNRLIFEKKYFGRRRNCYNIMVAYWLTQNEKYQEPLIDYINYICDEFTWCLPAHYDFINGDPQEAVECIDLFQAETARMFAEIVMCVGDKLPEFIKNRMRYEVRRRIFPTILPNSTRKITKQNPQNTDKYWWEICKMNWAVVCGAGCTMAALYFANDEEKEYLINRFTGCLDSYLEGVGDDGCCQEGMAYWGYGFSHFVILAEAIKVYTNCKIDYFKLPKVKALALFPQKVRMSPSKVASISDGGEVFQFKIGVLSFLKSMYHEVRLPELKYGTCRGNVDSVSELLWFDDNYNYDGIPCEFNYLSDSQWYINRRENFCFVAKGGHNDEPHNHNDIGSFMITVGDETFIADLGCGEYVKETFMPETRYNFIQNSSRGHSVPIINGQYQKEGREYAAKDIKASDTEFKLNIEGTYDLGGINEIKRHFIIYDDKVSLKDTFDYSLSTVSVKERFVSRIKPEICDGYIDFTVARIVYDSKKYVPSISMDFYIAHNSDKKVNIYLIDFEAVSDKENVFEFDFIPNNK